MGTKSAKSICSYSSLQPTPAMTKSSKSASKTQNSFQIGLQIIQCFHFNCSIKISVPGWGPKKLLVDPSFFYANAVANMFIMALIASAMWTVLQMLLVCQECTPKVGIAILSVQKSSIRPVAATTLNRSSGHVCCMILNRSLGLGLGLLSAVLYCVL